MGKKIYIIITVFLLMLVAGCQNSQMEKEGEEGQGEKLNVYTTVYPLQFITKQIGGDSVDVKTIYPPGSDEHTYEPSQRDMINLADSDLFLYIGLGLESFVGKAESTLKNEHVTLAPVGEDLLVTEEVAHEDHNHGEEEADSHAEATHEEHNHGEEEADNHAEATHEEHDNQGHDHGDVDPHVWIDPVLMKELASNVLVSMTEKMPEQKQAFEKNYQSLAKELDKLDVQFKEIAENAKRKKIIVPHAAYGYWELRYGIEQIAISGLSSANEPSQKKLQSIIDVIKEEQVPYILFEQNSHSKLADVVRKETKVEALHIHNLAVLTEKDIKNKDDYLTLMERNLKVLEKALN
ncbi:metal ABC transporter solute-binding protein, Zn/Mn family [Bacillus sp. FSL K6-3431]|uniref:metal ABC transporter solute-binding protein, Zn/Mn family n=1 Tax=Bacillus sp. FSL K6-3431 TaxID=2921500 RepID=UPI0030F7092D